ncbi:DUF2249 domain-containing protein [Yaniella halotolerans]|uniref:DUF2249 domain-containing protein n=1 Tax=Yaniella halotolerans TaxID=225453 RepID=UPI0003B47731|nr:DUF2249 domain-containing protein [Yaniella halotolerans]
MSQSGTHNAAEREVDIRGISANAGERLTLQAYEKLQVNDSLILLNDRKPDELYETFECEFAGSFSWNTFSTDAGEYRVRMTKRAATALPRIVANTTELATTSDAKGSVWQLEPGARDLDSNIIALPPHDEIAQHVGPDLDVLIHVLHGSGELETELDTISLQPGLLLWLPKKSQRRFTAGPDGLQYFTVHQRKPTLGITTGSPR